MKTVLSRAISSSIASRRPSRYMISLAIFLFSPRMDQ
jgi:hypothetical protein